MSGLLNAFGFGNSCSNDCDDSFIWIIVILLLFCCNDGNNSGCFGGDNIWLIVLLFLFCGNNNNPCGCDTCTCDAC